MSFTMKLKNGLLIGVDYNQFQHSIKLYNEWNDSIKVSLEELNYIKEVLRVHLKVRHGIIAISQ